jgi:uncharacterized protein
MTLRTEPVSMWFDGRILLRRSPIQGIGTFAIDTIRVGETVIWVSGGIVFSSTEASQVIVEPELYNQEQIGSDLFLINPKLHHYYINHSCNPNTIYRSGGTQYQFSIIRDVVAQEELTLDYGMYGEAEIEQCSCGSLHCRGRVTPDDWRIPTLQERYRGYFPLHIEQQITSMRG